MTVEKKDCPCLSQPAACGLAGELALLGTLSQRQLATAEAALVQTLEVMDDAIARLQASFLGMHGVLREQEAGPSGAALAPEAGHSSPSAAAAQHVGDAVTALQFQDISSQLLADCQRRIQGVRALLAAALPAGAEDGPPVCLQPAVSEALARQGAQLDSLPPSPIARSCRDSGDVELF